MAYRFPRPHSSAKPCSIFSSSSRGEGVNLGVFLFTLMRLITLRSLLTIFVLTVAFPFILGVGSRAAEDALVDTFIPTLLHSILPMLVAYTLVADTIANSKNLSDG